MTRARALVRRLLHRGQQPPDWRALALRLLLERSRAAGGLAAVCVMYGLDPAVVLAEINNGSK